MQTPRRAVSLALLVFVATGCSTFERVAVNRLGDAIAATGDTFSADDDPELIAAALPFSLKLIESLIAETPRHRGLLTAAAKGFTQYSYGWVANEAERLEETDLERANETRARARRLYLRARDYGLRALEARDERITRLLSLDPVRGAAIAKREDVAALYWTAAAWGLAIGVSKDDPDLVADLPIVEALIRRAAELEPTYGNGAIETFLLSYEAAGADSPANEARARERFKRAVDLSNGQLASPYIAFAESISVKTQNRAEFESLLQSALAVDLNARPEWRLENILAQRRAERLLKQSDELFLDTTVQSDPSENVSEVQ